MTRIVYATYESDDYSVTFSGVIYGKGEVEHVLIESATILGVEHSPVEMKRDLREALLDKVSELSGSEWSE